MSPLRSILAKGISLKIVIFLTCVALIVACAGTVTLVTYNANSGLILGFARDSFEKTGIETINNTEYLLQPVAAAIDSMATLIDNDETSINKPSLSRFLYGIINLYPQVYSAYVGSQADGRFVQVQRLDAAAKLWGPKQSPVPPNSRFVLRTVDGTPPDRTDAYRYISNWGRETGAETVPGAIYDPRGRPFYVAALSATDRVLTDIYTFASNGKPGITIARKLERDGKSIGVVAADITLERLSQFLAAQPVGAHGLALIVDAQGKVVAAPPEGTLDAPLAKTIHDLNHPALDAAWELYKANSTATFTFPGPGGDFLAAFRRFPARFDKDWVIMEVAPVDDFVGALKATLRRITLFSLIVAAVGGCFSLFVAGLITKPIQALTLEADRIRSLLLDGGIKGESRIREIQHLIDSMSAMKTALRTLAGEETDQASIAHLLQGADPQSPHAKLFGKVVEKVELRRARETELSLAAAIQHSVLPKPDEGSDRPVRISARMRAAKEIGGDFYDWIWRDDHKLVFVIGDVSGKGIPAALFMASTRTAIRTMIMSGRSVSETVEGTNRLLSENNDRCFFVTLFIGELDLGQGLLTYLNAGHEPARVIATDGTLSELLPGGPALGVIEDAAFAPATFRLRAGDTVLALTDGVTDAVSRTGERFGEARLERAAAVEADTEAAGIVERIFTAVDEFAGGELQFDDITCIVLRYEPDLVPRREAA